LAVVIGMTLLLMPRTLTINEYLGEAVEGGDAVPSDVRRYVRIDKRWVQVEQIARNDKNGEFIYFLNGKWSEPTTNLEYARIPRDLSSDDKRALRKKQAIFITTAFIDWLAPWLVLYLCGLAIAWIIDGFRSKKQ